MKMKAQIKAIVASAVVIALCLAAVGGVTYSWFSDSEESTIDVETAVVSIETTYDKTTSGTVETDIKTDENGIDTITIEKLSANCTSTITGTIVNNSNISVKYKVDATINYPANSPLTPYDKTKIFINGTSLKNIGDSTNITPWTPLDNNTKTFTVEIETPADYGGMPGDRIYYDNDGNVVPAGTLDSTLWEPKESRGFSVELKVVAVQSDYEYVVIDENVKRNELNNGNATISSAKPGANGEPKVEESLGNNNKVSNVTIELTGLSDASTLSVESKQSSSAGGTFSVTSNTNALAVIEVDANDASFTSAKVIVDIKGMIPNPTVVYNGTQDKPQPTDIKSEYVNKGGETYTRIYFTTSHFSEYLILDKDSTLTVTTEAQLRLALQSGFDVKLDNNIEIDDKLTIDGQKVTLDLNNHSITSKKSGIYVTNNADLTITDSGTDGSIIAGTENNGSYWALKASDSIVLIEDGYFYVGSDEKGEGNSCIIAADANITITGGLFKTKESWNNFYYVLNITQTHGDTYGFNVLGGTFVNYNPSIGDDVLGGNFVANGYTVDLSEDNEEKYYQVVKSVAYIGDTGYPSLNSAIAASNEGDTITICKDGSYILPEIPNKITIEGCSKNVIIDATGPEYISIANIPNGISFKNVTLNNSNVNYRGFQHAGEIVFDDCIINNQLTCYSKTSFLNSTINLNSVATYIWTYGAETVTFDNCTFNTVGKAILIYNEGNNNTNQTININNCILNASKSVSGKAAIEIDSSLIGTGSFTINIKNTTSNGFDNGSVSENSLWNEKKGNRSTITVDGNVVREAL